MNEPKRITLDPDQLDQFLEDAMAFTGKEELFEREWFTVVDKEELSNKNIVNRITFSTDDEGVMYIEDLQTFIAGKPKFNKALTKYLAKKAIQIADGHETRNQSVAIISDSDTINELYYLFDNYGLEVTPSEWDFTAPNGGSIYLYKEQSSLAMCGMAFHAVFVDENIEVDSDVVQPTLRGHNGDLFGFNADPVFGKFSITKFKR